MLKYGQYTIEILGMPSGQIIPISKLSIDELKKHHLIKYKRHIKMYGKKKNVHGWIFLDTMLSKIKNINNNY